MADPFPNREFSRLGVRFVPSPPFKVSTMMIIEGALFEGSDLVKDMRKKVSIFHKWRGTLKISSFLFVGEREFKRYFVIIATWKAASSRTTLLSCQKGQNELSFQSLKKRLDLLSKLENDCSQFISGNPKNLPKAVLWRFLKQWKVSGALNICNIF